MKFMEAMEGVEKIPAFSGKSLLHAAWKGGVLFFMLSITFMNFML
jgi:hypothetical protein